MKEDYYCRASGCDRKLMYTRDFETEICTRCRLMGAIADGEKKARRKAGRPKKKGGDQGCLFT